MDSDLSQSIGIFAVIFIVAIIFFIWYSSSGNTAPSPKSSKKSVKEGFKHGNDFYIYNYLLKPVKIDVRTKGGLTDRLIDIPARKRKGLRMKDVKKYIRAGNELSIYVVIDPSFEKENEKGGVKDIERKDAKKAEELLFSKYMLDLPEDYTIKALHVGMITSRWVGAGFDQNYIPALNAVQGRPWIKIHNFTDIPLSLNNNIDISSEGILRYTGRDHFGVRLGTIFDDQKGIFPRFKFNIPATDVYYGVTSDIQQSLFGGWQIDEKFIDDSDEPHFLLENGFQGGPANGNIVPGFLPKEGPPLRVELNRWGLTLDKSLD